MSATKSKITCFECGSSYSLDLTRLSPKVLEIKCMKCGKQVPILRRVLKAKSDKGKAPAEDEKKLQGNEAAVASQGSWEQDLREWDEDSGVTGGGEDDNSWLAIYGDMMSILLIFFILLFAISTVDRKKFETVMQSVNNALGGTVKFVQVDTPPSPAAPPTPLELFKKEVMTEKSVLAELRKKLDRFIQDNRLQDKFAILDESDGLVLIAQDMTMFDLGSAEIRPSMVPSLKTIGDILGAIHNDIVVEGHTDDLPIHSGRFASNWELSVMRATNVVHYLVTECGLDPNRLAAAGYAYYKPRFALDSQDKEKNRRIEVVIKKKYSDKLVDELLQAH